MSVNRQYTVRLISIPTRISMDSQIDDIVHQPIESWYYPFEIILQINEKMSFYDLIHLADSSFVRAEPARKSGSGFIKMLKKSFGKGKHKRNRKLSEMTSSPPREISSPREIHQPKPDDGHPPDIWLSQSQTGIQKPVPRKPPRRTRSKSGSGKTNF